MTATIEDRKREFYFGFGGRKVENWFS